MRIPPPPPRDPFLKAAGPVLRNDRGLGDEVPLRGVNLGAWLVLEPWMCPLDTDGQTKDQWTGLAILERRFGLAEAERLFGLYQDAWIQDQDFDRIAALGMNVVRIPVWWLTFQHRDRRWRTDGFARLDRVVAAAWKRGIHTIIDLHGPEAPQRAKAHCTGHITETAPLWTDEAGRQHMVDLWIGIARHYAGNPAIAGYDLLNEPMDVPRKEQLWDLYDRCYRGIRAVDPDHTLIMEATFGSWNLGMLPEPRSRGWENVAYQYHAYAWKDWNDVEKTRANVRGTIDDWRRWDAWQVPAQVGEFNMGTVVGWESAVRDFSAAGLSWMSWSYKCKGNSTWGLYHSGKACIVPTLATDSAERIAKAWSTWHSGNFIPGGLLGTVAMPVAVDESFSTAVDAPLAVPAPGVLANDRRWNGSATPAALTARLDTAPRHGTCVLAEDGSFRYVPAPGFRGGDVFAYRVGDGRTWSVRVARCTIDVGP